MTGKISLQSLSSVARQGLSTITTKTYNQTQGSHQDNCVYKHLKDRTKPIADKLKLVQLVWKSKRIYLQNKEQVLIDFLSGLILNKKRFKLSENDVYNVWNTLSELLHTSKSTKRTKSQIIIKPSICQVINDSICLPSSYHHHVIQSCLDLLLCPSLSHVYNKFDHLCPLLSNILQWIVKSDGQEDDSHWTLLQVVVPRYLQVQRSHTNQKMVLQTVTDKLLVPVLLLQNDSRLSKIQDLDKELIKVLHNALFSKDHTSSYTVFLHSIVPDASDRTQPPKHIENFFGVLSQCINCKSVQSGIPVVRIRTAVLKYIPVYFKAFIVNNKITDCGTVKDLFVYFCKLLGIKILLPKDMNTNQPECQGQQDVLEVISHLLETIFEMDLYDKSHDPVYRQLIQILLTCDRSKGYFTCLVSLIKLNHLIFEAKMEIILQQIFSKEVQDQESLDDFLVELVQLYSKLRQMNKFVSKLVNVLLNGKVITDCLFTEQFQTRLCHEVETLPQGTAVEIWQTLVQRMEDNFVCPLSTDPSDCDLTSKFGSFVHLLTKYMSSTKLIDYTITDINKRKVKDIMVTMETQLSKLIGICTKPKYNQCLELVFPTILLLHTWGDVHLLMCQYIQHTELMVEESSTQPHWISNVYPFIKSPKAEKLYKLLMKTRKLQYMWNLLKMQTLKSLWMTNRSRTHVIDQLNLPVIDTTVTSWNIKVWDITDENYPVAKWKLFTENFALYGLELSRTQLEMFATFITDTVSDDIGTGRNITVGSITNKFLKSCNFTEHIGLITAVVSDIWRKLENSDQWKKQKKIDKIQVLTISNVFKTLGDKGWLEKNRGFLERINLNDVVKKSLVTSINNMDFTEQFLLHLKYILSHLQLPFLDHVDQIRCFVGLFVICYHGNQELKRRCLPLLRNLLESSTAILKAIDLDIFLNSILTLYVYQNGQTLYQSVEIVISTCFKSVCKERDMLEKMDNFVAKLKDVIIFVEKRLHKNLQITKQQESCIQLTSVLIQQLHTVIKRPYVREDMLAICKNYIETLAVPVFSLLNTLRQFPDQDTVLTPVTRTYALLLNQSDEKHLNDAEKSEKMFRYIVDWSLNQLQCNVAEEKTKAAIDFLTQSCNLKDTIQLSYNTKTDILNRCFNLLKQQSLCSVKSDKMEIDADERMEICDDKRTCDLSDDLLSLVSTVVVSCDVSHFKDLLHKLEQSINIDLSITDPTQITVCLNVWYHLLSSHMSEEQSSGFIQSVLNLTGYLSSLAQQLSSTESSDGIDRLICGLQHKVLLTCPVNKQMILTMLGSVLLIPVTMETFSSMYEILNEVLLNHYNTAFDIIPVFLSCCKYLLFWIIKQGDQEILSKTPDVTADLIGCVHMIDRLFTLISTHKEEFSKVVVYVVADYVDHVHQCTLLPAVKKALVSAIYKLLDIGDKHVLAQLHTVLNQGVHEVFKGLYSDYTNFYKYTGKV